jgi:hypothetical protein
MLLGKLVDFMFPAFISEFQNNFISTFWNSCKGKQSARELADFSVFLICGACPLMTGLNWGR